MWKRLFLAALLVGVLNRQLPGQTTDSRSHEPRVADPVRDVPSDHGLRDDYNSHHPGAPVHDGLSRRYRDPVAPAAVWKNGSSWHHRPPHADNKPMFPDPAAPRGGYRPASIWPPSFPVPPGQGEFPPYGQTYSAQQFPFGNFPHTNNGNDQLGQPTFLGRPRPPYARQPYQSGTIVLDPYASPGYATSPDNVPIRSQGSYVQRKSEAWRVVGGETESSEGGVDQSAGIDNEELIPASP